MSVGFLRVALELVRRTRDC